VLQKSGLNSVEPRDSLLAWLGGGAAMIGVQAEPARLFYDFRLDDHVPGDHLLRGIDRFLDLGSIRVALKRFYSTQAGSVDPELMIWMLVVGILHEHTIRTEPVRRGPFEPGVSLVLPPRAG
jgi:hypothetical protein